MKKSQKALLVGNATLMLLFLGILYTWSMFRIELAAAFPEWSAAQLSLNFTITSIGFCLGGFFSGKLFPRLGPRPGARAAAVMLLVGFVGCSFIDKLSGTTALAVLYVCYGAITGLGVGIGYNSIISGTSPWFPDSIGLVSGIMLMGFGLGSLLLGLAVEALCGVMSVFRVFRVCGIVIFLILMAGSFLLQRPAPAVPKAEMEDEAGLSPGKVLTTASFWVYFIWNTVASSSGLMVINSSANIALAFGCAAGLGLTVSLFNGLCRPLVGTMMDKLGRLGGMLIMNGILLLGGLLLITAAKTGFAALVFAGMILVGVCYGGGVTISARVIRDLYGPKYYSVNFSLSNFCMIPAAFIGPLLSGVLQDRSGGAYDSTFLLLTGMALLALAAAFLLDFIVKKESRRA